MNKLKQIFISQAFVVEGERPVDKRWERCIFGAGSTAIALTKGELPGKMKMLRCTRTCARVAELADALASGASDRKVVEVRVLSRAPISLDIVP